ncbi:PQQ-binding-like beta-propeller repeat protein [Salipaludibacillus sp. HK11]|uniref:outer membrane protein assembly factor BamB family protein n=1 Tax=Salipaludibacillus sp. HK11 TaxID=3394320 RepID=UPI0039FC3271
MKMLCFALVFVILLGCNQSEEVDQNNKGEDADQIEVKVNTEEKIDSSESKPKQEEKEIEEKVSEDISLQKQTIAKIAYSLIDKNDIDVEYESDQIESFPEEYTEMKGILTFRGSHLRDSPSFGNVKIAEKKLEEKWSMMTDRSPNWGGGSGWTGQPVIIEWDPEVREIMNIKEKFRELDNFKEVIFGSLDGNVYFLDFESGEKSREPIQVGNPIKGSISVDPRGYPLLYVGDGVPEKAEIGWRIYDLIDQNMLYFQKGLDSHAYRSWGAFDGSAIVNRETDTLVLGGENGMFYQMRLNTQFRLGEKDIEIDPEIIKYRYQIEGNDFQGIENSVAVYKNIAYFADNAGSLQAIDLRDLQPIWALPALDDTDSTIVIEEEEDNPFLFTGSEVDNIGKDGDSYLRKINGLTGEVVWKKEYSAFYYPGVVGGVLATPIVGEQEIDDVVIYTIARHKQRYAGIMVALDKDTGEEVWNWEMPNYAWSSPVAIYDEDGTSYIIQADSVGNIYLLEGESGVIVDEINMGSNIEASPIVYENTIIVASRGGEIFGITIK